MAQVEVAALRFQEDVAGDPVVMSLPIVELTAAGRI
jgi:hypothetical protein